MTNNYELLSNILCVAVIAALFGLPIVIYTFLIRKAQRESQSDGPVEPAYLVIRLTDGYPMTMNEQELEQALDTGAYQYAGPAPEGGYFYSDGDQHQGTWVPEGYRPVL